MYSIDFFNRYSKDFDRGLCNNPVISTDDILYEDVPFFKSLGGAKLFVIGGGPTTNEREWDPSNYDIILSCNHFFLNEKLANTKVDFAHLSYECDFQRAEFKNYLNKYNTLFCFENFAWDHTKAKINQFKKDYPDRSIQLRLRYDSKLGVGARLLVMATLFNPASIDFVGIDGYKPGVKLGDDSAHSFESGKRCTTTYPYELLYQQYLQLNTYLKSTNIKMNNLGAGHPYNILGTL